jgi:hypothetical protein
VKKVVEKAAPAGVKSARRRESTLYILPLAYLREHANLKKNCLVAFGVTPSRSELAIPPTIIMSPALSIDLSKAEDCPAVTRGRNAGRDDGPPEGIPRCCT